MIGESHLQNANFYNLYGPAETTLTSIYRKVSIGEIEQGTVAIGIPFANVQIQLTDIFDQSVMLGQEGELLIGGHGVFAGYLGRDDLNQKALVNINGKQFYRTGDLARMNSEGLLYYLGRKDHQIKLHGQRIELGEIERCLLNITSISACVVMKWGEDRIVAYLQRCSPIYEKEIREHCQLYLPLHMIPSFFVILDKLPLNLNGKIDRKQLPPPVFSSALHESDDNVPQTSLEQQIQEIFCQAFSVENPALDIPLNRLGGTSLNIIMVLTLLRRKVYDKVDITFLLSNPSIRQLTKAIESLLKESRETNIIDNDDHKLPVHSRSSLFIESVGVLFLMCQWLWPVMMNSTWWPFCFSVMPIIHLIVYVICSRLFSFYTNENELIFSWNYYRWWFLDRLWHVNTFWLQHLIGTPLYNSYLRLCGAHIGEDAHIYTTTIDAPWLLDIGNATWIADQTFLNCLYYNDNNTFTLYPIKIGSNCSISTRSILFNKVTMEDNIIVQPMSTVTGFIKCQTIIDGEDHKLSSQNFSNSLNNRILSIWHKTFQITSLLLLICIHCLLLTVVCKIYTFIPVSLSINIAFCWVLWSILACLISLILLKYIVGSCTAGDTYSIASWSYLHKLWLRQLIVSSFHHAWLLPSAYDHIFPIILRWLGAHVGHNVKLAEIDTFLSYPTNLLHLETGVTTFGSVLLVPTELTFEGDHRVDWIKLGLDTNLGNGCSVLPGSHLASQIMVGNLTRFSRKISSNDGDTFIGISARRMPFEKPKTSAETDQIKIVPIWQTCLFAFVSKCILMSIYSINGFIIGLIIHTILFFSFYRCRLSINHQIIQQVITKTMLDYQQLICPFLSNTQWLVRLFRALGSNIGDNVILPDFSCLTDYHMVTIGNNVRLNQHANIQCHSFEQRILKLAPVVIGDSCILMSGSFVMAGCKIMNNNRLHPFTLVMKNDILLPYNQWKGVPAQLIVSQSRPSQFPAIAPGNTASCLENDDSLSGLAEFFNCDPRNMANSQ
ncbi:unnamed protein product [Adineta ricciae]|uniref:Carrier domain-containing protein n=1 Tax=Adineta ricciae TaxID=249248 RepID=A0A815R4Q8_ADIRI|nr:unnamed protein product [Adineta ricciae]CAF1471659.1 unnamed protein product [Adineta ricciae]